MPRYTLKIVFNDFEIGFMAIVVLFLEHWRLFCINWRFCCIDTGENINSMPLKFS